MDKNIFNTKHTSNVRDINRIFTVQAKLLSIMPDMRRFKNVQGIYVVFTVQTGKYSSIYIFNTITTYIQ